MVRFFLVRYVLRNLPNFVFEIIDPFNPLRQVRIFGSFHFSRLRRRGKSYLGREAGIQLQELRKKRVYMIYKRTYIYPRRLAFDLRKPEIIATIFTLDNVLYHS